MPLSDPTSPDSIGVSPKSKSFATVSGDINITLLGGGPARRIRTGGAGALALDYGNGITDIIPACLAGENFDVQACRILQTGTTATNITIFW